MRGGLRANLIGAIVSAIGALVLTIVLLEDPLLEYRESVRAEGSLHAAAQAAAAAIASGEGADAAADRVGAITATRITVVAPDGMTLGDTARDGNDLSLVAAAEAEEVAEARRGAEGVARRQDPDAREPALFVAIARPDGTVVRASRPLAAIHGTHHSMRELLAVGGVVALLISIVLTVALSRTMVKPIEELTAVADALSAGDLSARTRSQRLDELGTLGRSIDAMADQLAERLENLRVEEDRLRTLLDSMVEAVLVTDRLGRVVLTNAALDRMIGARAVGRTVIQAVRSPELHRAVSEARRGTTSAVEVEIRVAGEQRVYVAHVSPLEAGSGVVAVLHDVTELKLADRVRRDFVANASHELRTPLTAIRGFAETLRDATIEDPEATRRFLDTIVKHTLRLQRLVNDLLVLSRAESPDETWAVGELDAGAIALEVVAGLKAQAAAKRIDLGTEGLAGLPSARASEQGLDHVLVNLVDNAIKYTPEGGSVRVRGTSDASRVVLEVSDTGPGIPPQHLDRIFERFYRIDAGRSRDVGGTGLGLSIVKHLALRMDAEVAVESKVGRGSTFRVVMKRGSAREDEARREDDASAPRDATST